MTKTKWFPANVKPVRKGWYETTGCNSGLRPCMHLWTGKHWSAWSDGMEYGQLLPWRGLTTKEAK